jgi:hypothetical protein
VRQHLTTTGDGLFTELAREKHGDSTLNRCRQRCVAVLVLAVGILAARELRAQEFKIGSIDFYGTKRVSLSDIQRVLTFKAGDPIVLTGGRPAYLTESERKISVLPGVKDVRTTVVCCDAGNNIVIFIGIEETEQTRGSFRASPNGAVRLPADVVAAGEAFDAAFMAAIQRGDSGEDRSQGHSLFHDPATRGIQERFIDFARRDLQTLRDVLRDSSDARERALAAQVLGYVTDKQAVVGDLVDAMSDSSEEVRNNAMRALLVFASMSPAQSAPRVPWEPFVRMLNSTEWTDRNKASGALMELSTGRDRELLTAIRKEAMDSLVEMARWKSRGHAKAAFMILGRMTPLADEELNAAWDRDDRESVIRAASTMPLVPVDIR